MGQGLLNVDRPFTAGDSGWLGIERPLVGAANAIKAKVSTQSAAHVALAYSTPERIENLNEQINNINKEIDNKQAKLEKYEDLGEFTILRDEPISMRAAERRRDSLIEEIELLKEERGHITSELDSVKQDTKEGDLKDYEIKDGIEDPVENALLGLGVSKGPFIDVGSETTTILFTKTGISEDDITETNNRLQDLGFQVGHVEGMEV